MADGSGVSGARYRAFISYSHRDAAFAARLHRRLEGYVLPKRLGAGRRLTPIFKDREELPAAHDLSAQVRAALAASDCLIVVCSPDAAASPWVGREIALFRELHPERPILAALVRGEPAEAFPAALSDGGVEPLAADFRKEADGERLALMKLVAGIAGVGVDQLVQRDAQRRIQGVMAVTAAAIGTVAILSLVTAFALAARAEAERQRVYATGLIEFMLTDLRDSLEDVGRLGLLTKVTDQALEGFAGQEIDRLPAASRLLYAKLIQAKGADETVMGRLDTATERFNEASRLTSRLLKSKPRDKERLWAHGQSLYGIGYVQFQRGNAKAANKAWQEYLELARRLSESSPNDPRAIRELAFAEGNICSVHVDLDKVADKAVNYCRLSLELMRRSAALEPNSPDSTVRVANRVGWYADALELSGDLDRAQAERKRQAALLAPVLANDPKNLKARDNWVGSQRALSRIAYRKGSYADSKRRMSTVLEALTAMTREDPQNTLWRSYLDRANRDYRVIDQKIGRTETR